MAPKHIMDINDKELYESIIRTNTPNQEKINKEKLENSIVECPSDIEESASMGLRRNSFDSTLVDRKSDKFIVSADVHCANSINSETFGSLPEVEIKERLSEWLTTDLSSYHPVVDSINRKPNNRRPSV